MVSQKGVFSRMIQIQKMRDVLYSDTGTNIIFSSVYTFFHKGHVLGMLHVFLAQCICITVQSDLISVITFSVTFACIVCKTVPVTWLDFLCYFEVTEYVMMVI